MKINLITELGLLPRPTSFPDLTISDKIYSGLWHLSFTGRYYSNLVDLKNDFNQYVESKENVITAYKD